MNIVSPLKDPSFSQQAMVFLGKNLFGGMSSQFVSTQVLAWHAIAPTAIAKGLISTTSGFNYPLQLHLHNFTNTEHSLIQWDSNQYTKNTNQYRNAKIFNIKFSNPLSSESISQWGKRFRNIATKVQTYIQDSNISDHNTLKEIIKMIRMKDSNLFNFTEGIPLHLSITDLIATAEPNSLVENTVKQSLTMQNMSLKLMASCPHNLYLAGLGLSTARMTEAPIEGVPDDESGHISRFTISQDHAPINLYPIADNPQNLKGKFAEQLQTIEFKLIYSKRKKHINVRIKEEKIKNLMKQARLFDKSFTSANEGFQHGYELVKKYE